MLCTHLYPLSKGGRATSKLRKNKTWKMRRKGRTLRGKIYSTVMNVREWGGMLTASLFTLNVFFWGITLFSAPMSL